MILQLKDGGILNIESDRDYFKGCDTCDYGSSYVNFVEFKLTKKTIKVEVSQNQGYPLSEGYMIKLFVENVDKIKNMSEEEFANWLRVELEENFSCVEITY